MIRYSANFAEWYVHYMSNCRVHFRSSFGNYNSKKLYIVNFTSYYCNFTHEIIICLGDWKFVFEVSNFELLIDFHGFISLKSKLQSRLKSFGIHALCNSMKYLWNNLIASIFCTIRWNLTLSMRNCMIINPFPKWKMKAK